MILSSEIPSKPIRMRYHRTPNRDPRRVHMELQHKLEFEAETGPNSSSSLYIVRYKRDTNSKINPASSIRDWYYRCDIFYTRIQNNISRSKVYSKGNWIKCQKMSKQNVLPKQENQRERNKTWQQGNATSKAGTVSYILELTWKKRRRRRRNWESNKYSKNGFLLGSSDYTGRANSTYMGVLSDLCYCSTVILGP